MAENKEPPCGCKVFRECVECFRLYCEHGYVDEELLPQPVKVVPFHICAECSG